MNGYKKLLNGVQVLDISCNQWGDSGKGKFVDLFAEWADIIARTYHRGERQGLRYSFGAIRHTL
mgnify:CR=1 FL=1